MAFSINPLPIISIFIILWACTSRAWSRSIHESSSAIAKQHEKWMAKYNKVYADSAEKEKRRQIFKDNLDYINNFNSEGNRTFTLALNAFSDLTEEEFRASYTAALYEPTTESKNEMKYINVSLSDYEDYEQNLDWRQRGAVDGVKTQGQCGCCWAFAAVAAVEAAIKIKTGNPLIPLSEQQLMDCTNGCNPDNVYHSYDYIRERGLASENQYNPYHMSAGTCQVGAISARISGYQTVPPNDEEQLRRAVANQPVVVLLDSSGFQQYSSGIFNGNCGTNLDHYVTVVGYGVDESYGRKYWLIKNSWGESWGEGGYMRMQRDSGFRQGLCGITMQATYPVV